jgi:O-antigen ligase
VAARRISQNGRGMTMQATQTAAERSDRSAQAGRSGLFHRPMWILAGQLGVVIAIVLGFGARASFRPKQVAVMLLFCLVAAVALAPERRLYRIVVTAPVVAILAWWIASYLWTFNLYGWWTDTQLSIPLVVTCIALASVLPTREFRAAVVVGCYVAIGYTVLELVVHHAAASVNPDGVPGWRGGFIHKNAMAPFMVFAILALVCFDRPGPRRRVAIGTALVLIFFSQSTSALIAGSVVFVVCLFLRRFAASDAQARASLLAGSLAGVLVIALLSTTVLPALLRLRGKDETLTGRTDIWHGVWHAITKRPWEGYGIGGVWSNPSVDPGRSIMRNLGFVVFHSHNGFLEIMLVLGVIGLALYVWLMVSTIRLGLLNLRYDTPMAVMAVGMVTLVAMLSISEVTVFGIWLAMLSSLNCLITMTDSQRRGRRDTHRT